MNITATSYNLTAYQYAANTAKLQPEVKASLFLSRLPPQSTILDLGCGPGRDAKFFTEHGHSVIGVDISPNMIELAKREVPGASFIISDIESFSHAPHSLDAIWASASLIHVSKSQMPATLLNLHAMLKPEGIFYLSMKKGEGELLTPDERYDGVEKFWNYVDEEEISGLLRDAGFTILTIDTHQKSTAYQTHPWISIICQPHSK